MSETRLGFGIYPFNYAAVGLGTAILTAVAVMALRGFVSEHPVASIILFLSSAMAVLPFNKLMIPYMKIFFRKYVFVIVPAIMITVGILALSKYFVLAFLLLLHILMSIFLRVLKKNHIGVEIIMLITVLSGVAYGPKVGALMGAVSMVIDYVFSGRFSYFCIVTIPTYAAIGTISGVFAAANIVTVGIFAVIAYNLFTWIFILGFMGGHLDKCLRFGATDLAFNAFVFSAFAPTLLAIMA